MGVVVLAEGGLMGVELRASRAQPAARTTTANVVSARRGPDSRMSGQGYGVNLPMGGHAVATISPWVIVSQPTGACAHVRHASAIASRSALLASA